MTLEQYLNILADKDQPLRHADLLHLSGMTPEEMGLLRRGWQNIDAERRRAILERLVEMAEDNLEADFNDLFRFCLVDENTEVRAKAVEGLWECDDRTLLTPLATLLRKDPAEKVRAA
ncbi:MAG: lyase domain protein repeat-containing protein, partial [Dehalococcoidia bacterium]|nr:lyase domain protein repeat-containing protein [Dehalococcoidia bacterium]